jgi:excisionase family DNA binding protein
VVLNRPPDAERTVNAQEAAELLGVAEKTVRRWIQQRKLDAHKVGRSFVIRETDVRRMEEHLPRRYAIRSVRDLRSESRQQDVELAALRAKYELLEAQLAEARRELREALERAAAAEALLQRRAA